MIVRTKKKSTNYIAIVAIAVIVLIVSCAKESPTPAKATIDITSLQFKSGHGYSGEDMFRGIFFMNGAFFPEITTYDGVDLYAGLSDTIVDSALVLQNKIIVAINNSHSTFFSDFETELKSGSCTRIDKALDNAVTTFITTVNTMPEFGDLVKMQTGETVIHKEMSPTSAYAFTDTPSDSLLINNPELLMQNSLVNSQGPPQLSAAVALVAVVYIAVAVHNTVAVTGFVAGVGVAAVYLAVVLWTGKWCWSGALTGVPSGDIPSNISKLNGLHYETFVSDLSNISYH
ncbi:unnamed protein product [Rotaria sp. Silwood2]|nr:unnamed protein product [Rotaria sp. Silwood2]CAF4003420.1 unnamed protein product [Rotaria sp. Silwood2]